jgi:hypothetical protein
MEILYKKVLDDLLVNQEKLTKIEWVKVWFPDQLNISKTKVCTRQIHPRTIKRKKENHCNQDPGPTK